MKNEDLAVNPASEPEKSDSRRQFLQNASLAAGALILTRALPAGAQEGENAVPVATTPVATTPVATTTLNLSEHKALEKVGGFEIITIGAERVIVAHTGSGFTACGAVCPHRGCDVEYRLADKQFVCPCHNSRFTEAGKVVKGPAKTDLKPFDANNALVIKKR